MVCHHSRCGRGIGEVSADMRGTGWGGVRAGGGAGAMAPILGAPPAAAYDRPRCNGLHLIADLRGCPVRVPAVHRSRGAAQRPAAVVAEAGLVPVGELRFTGSKAGGGGVTGVVLLAESHLAVHTWPELGAVTLDVYVCNYNGGQQRGAQALLDLPRGGIWPRCA